MTFMTVALVLVSLTPVVNGHGYLIDPPGRSSMWRKGFNTPINYNDNQLFCGGAYNLNYVNKGKCGVCGDPWQGPRLNEAGGKYATGTIAKTYQSGQPITVEVIVTANHVGWFEFKLCPNNNPQKAITQECLDSHVLQLVNGHGSKYYITTATGSFKVDLQLPEGLTCSQCVLQWRWHTGNSWGVNPNGEGCLGCGPQEEFYGCSDVAISGDGSQHATPIPVQPTTEKPYQPPAQRPVLTQRPSQPPTHQPVVTQQPYQPPAQRPIVTQRPYKPPTQQPIVTQRPYKPPTQRPIVTQRPNKPPTQKPIVTQRPNKPNTPTPLPSGNHGLRCFGVNNWAGVKSLDKVCAVICQTGNCPPIYCKCE